MAHTPDIQAYNSRLDAFEIYHKEKEARLFAEPDLPALGHGIAGSVGAALSNAAIYPLNLLATRAQTKKRPAPGEKEQVQNPVEVARKIYADEGIRGLYAGLSIDTVKHSMDSFLFFMAYNTIRQARLQSLGKGRKHLPVFDELSVGFLAGAFSKFFTSPLSNIVTRLQTAQRGPGQNPSVASIAAKIKEEKGLTGFWTGYSANLILTLNPSLTFFFHEFFNRLLLPKSKREHPPFIATFFLAALSKSLASCVTYPVTLAKARAQTMPKKTKASPAEVKEGLEKTAGVATASSPKAQKAARQTIFSTVAHIAQTEGIAALYEGLELEVLKGFLSHGLTMVIKDFAHAFILKVYFAILKARSKFPDKDEQVRQSLSRTVEAAKSLRPLATSARELGEAIFDEKDQAPLFTADDLLQQAKEWNTADDVVQKSKEWTRAVADDVFERSSLKNHSKAAEFKELLVDFIAEHTKGKPRNTDIEG